MTEQNARNNIRINVRKLVVIFGLLCIICIVGYAKPNKVDSLSVRMENVERAF